MGFVFVFALLIGLLLLIIGAESFVRGAAKLAAVVGLSPLVIGLTVVSYGTSAPELAVSVQASLVGQPEIALGNVIGSNIFNILMTLGIAALVVPLTVAQQLIRLDVPIMIGVTALLLLFVADGVLSQTDGTILLVGGVVYTVFLLWQSRKESDANVEAEYEQEYGSAAPRDWQHLLRFVLLLAVGLVLLTVGANLLVYGATAIAEAIGVSQLIIGLTVVAIGTSLPELATSVVACYRGERDIAVGNVVGSNIFNILTVLGATSAIADITVSPAALRFDLPVMMVVAIACLPIFYTGNRISRWEGMLFISYYVAYTAYLGLNAINHDQLHLFSDVMLLFVIPLTVITLLTLILQRSPMKQTAAPAAKSPPTEPESSVDPSPADPSAAVGSPHPSEPGVKPDSPPSSF